MSKELVLTGWVSIVPDKMYNGWIKKKWIERGAVWISCGDDDTFGFKDCLWKDGEKENGYAKRNWKISGSKSETKRLETQGFKKERKQYYVTEQAYTAMRKEISNWYDEVFAYVDEWLVKHKYISLEKGSFSGGFCAETNPDHEVVKNWGAPLAKEDNKVTQIKEKFGRITIYFTSLSKEQWKEIKKFDKHLRKKFDCETSI